MNTVTKLLREQYPFNFKDNNYRLGRYTDGSGSFIAAIEGNNEKLTGTRGVDIIPGTPEDIAKVYGTLRLSDSMDISPPYRYVALNLLSMNNFQVDKSDIESVTRENGRYTIVLKSGLYVGTVYAKAIRS